MFGWFETHKRLRAENEASHREVLRLAGALERSLNRESDAIAMLEARDADLQKLRTELQRMTNVALARSLRPSQEQPRDAFGRFIRAA